LAGFYGIDKVSGIKNKQEYGLDLSLLIGFIEGWLNIF
jgi:hypothetical protein